MDILKITSAIPPAGRTDNAQSRLPGGAMFDINGFDELPRYAIRERGDDGDDPREALLRNLNREIFAPLKSDLSAQTETLRKLVMFLRFSNDPALGSKLGDLEALFVRPEEMLTELAGRDRDATVFRGELFDALRILAKSDAYPKLQEAIVNLLRAFDGAVNKESALDAVLKQTTRFAAMLKEDDARAVGELIGRIKAASASGNTGAAPATAASQREVAGLLKSELLPLLTTLADKYRFTHGTTPQNDLMAIIHRIVRFDKSDTRLLESAMNKLGDELKSFGRLNDEDVSDMRRLLFAHLREARERAPGTETGGFRGMPVSVFERERTERGERPLALASAPETDDADDAEAALKARHGGGAKNVAEILAKALETEAASKAGSAAQNMLVDLVRNESPILAVMHFLLPLKYMGEDVYSEVYADKDCAERKQEGDKEAQNIFFVIKSEKYGNFEVDLLARDRLIELEILCPTHLTDMLKAGKSGFRDMIEELGYRLSTYRIDAYKEERSVLRRFPKLAMRKAGIDVRI